MSNKDISYYMGLPYTVVLRRDEEDDVVARIEELQGCLAHGADESEAVKNLREAQRLWLEDCLEAGHVVPDPEPEEALPSGKWVQRVPRSLHQRLAQLAKRENVSLNQLVTSLLAESVSKRSVMPKKRPAEITAAEPARK